MKRCPACTQDFTSSTWQCPYCHWQAALIRQFPALAPKLAEQGAGFKSEHFRELAELEEKNFWYRSRNQLILWALDKYFPQSQNFLEIGCGTGYVLATIARSKPGLHITGSEIFAAGIDCAAERLPGANLIQMDARHLPYRREFDLIGAFDVLEHIVEDDCVLNEIYKALTPGGGLLLTVPQHDFLWSAADETACHVRRYCAGKLKAQVEQAGLRVMRLTSFVALLLPLMVVSRHWRGAKLDKIARTDLNLPPWLDRLLEAIMRLELGLIRSGVNFPCGGSLLLVAYKPR